MLPQAFTALQFTTTSPGQLPQFTKAIGDTVVIVFEPLLNLGKVTPPTGIPFASTHELDCEFTVQLYPVAPVT